MLNVLATYRRSPSVCEILATAIPDPRLISVAGSGASAKAASEREPEVSPTLECVTVREKNDNVGKYVGKAVGCFFNFVESNALLLQARLNLREKINVVITSEFNLRYLNEMFHFALSIFNYVPLNWVWTWTDLSPNSRSCFRFDKPPCLTETVCSYSELSGEELACLPLSPFSALTATSSSSFSSFSFSSSSSSPCTLIDSLSPTSDNSTSSTDREETELLDINELLSPETPTPTATLITTSPPPIAASTSTSTSTATSTKCQSSVAVSPELTLQHTLLFQEVARRSARLNKEQQQVSSSSSSSSSSEKPRNVRGRPRTSKRKRSETSEQKRGQSEPQAAEVQTDESSLTLFSLFSRMFPYSLVWEAFPLYLVAKSGITRCKVWGWEPTFSILSTHDWDLKNLACGTRSFPPDLLKGNWTASFFPVSMFVGVPLVSAKAIEAQMQRRAAATSSIKSSWVTACLEGGESGRGTKSRNTSRSGNRESLLAPPPFADQEDGLALPVHLHLGGEDATHRLSAAQVLQKLQLATPVTQEDFERETVLPLTSPLQSQSSQAQAPLCLNCVRQDAQGHILKCLGLSQKLNNFFLIFCCELTRHRFSDGSSAFRLSNLQTEAVKQLLVPGLCTEPCVRNNEKIREEATSRIFRFVNRLQPVHLESLAYYLQHFVFPEVSSVGTTSPSSTSSSSSSSSSSSPYSVIAFCSPCSKEVLEAHPLSTLISRTPLTPGSPRSPELGEEDKNEFSPFSGFPVSSPDAGLELAFPLHLQSETQPEEQIRPACPSCSSFTLLHDAPVTLPEFPLSQDYQSYQDPGCGLAHDFDPETDPSSFLSPGTQPWWESKAQARATTTQTAKADVHCDSNSASKRAHSSDRGEKKPPPGPGQIEALCSVIPPYLLASLRPHVYLLPIRLWTCRYASETKSGGSGTDCDSKSPGRNLLELLTATIWLLCIQIAAKLNPNLLTVGMLVDRFFLLSKAKKLPVHPDQVLKYWRKIDSNVQLQIKAQLLLRPDLFFLKGDLAAEWLHKVVQFFDSDVAPSHALFKVLYFKDLRVETLDLTSLASSSTSSTSSSSCSSSPRSDLSNSPQSETESDTESPKPQRQPQRPPRQPLRKSQRILRRRQEQKLLA